MSDMALAVGELIQAASDRHRTNAIDYWNALRELADAEAEYRHCHDHKGAGHIKTGRAWDAMRHAGDRARKLIAQR